ncbi:hypothetical protein [Clostridium sporogenes]|nr:hypothetical protein [Clostridium sporogenes]MCW6105234.1 hypothetical protein [Clostridium sporogenes]
MNVNYTCAKRSDAMCKKYPDRNTAIKVFGQAEKLNPNLGNNILNL